MTGPIGGLPCLHACQSPGITRGLDWNSGERNALVP